MGGVALLAVARAAGLTVRAAGDKLIIRGPRRCDALARSILAHKADVMAALEARPAGGAPARYIAFPVHRPQRVALSPVPLIELYPTRPGDEWLADRFYQLRRRARESTP